MSATIVFGQRPFREVNDEIRDLIARGINDIELEEVFGQRYIGDALPSSAHLTVKGTPGNDMGAYMEGASIEVFGNGQDQIANTMDAGSIVVHGHVGDAAGYAMRGGDIFIRDYCGWRTGIHMKQYAQRCPTIVIGGNAGSFLGEYMAGGVILLMGKPSRYLATGMHGGVIYLHDGIPADRVTPGLVQEECDASDLEVIEGLLRRYNDFADEIGAFPLTERFTKLRPASSRPYVNMYVNA